LSNEDLKAMENEWITISFDKLSQSADFAVNEPSSEGYRAQLQNKLKKLF